MKRLYTLLMMAALLLPAAAGAQDSAPNTQELPEAPAPQPLHLPMPARQPVTQAPAQPAAGTTSLQPLPNGGVPAAKSAPEAKPATAQPSTQPTPKDAASQPAAGAAPSPAAAAQPGEQAEDAGFHIGVEVNLVNLIFTATDKRGHFIKDLKADDIQLLDEGKPPLRINAFESETGLPLRVGLLVDASNSIRERFRFEQEAAGEFLQQVVRPKSDLAFVIGFDSEADLTQNYTDNTELLARGVSVLRPGGGTALHDAIYTASEKLAKAPVHGAVRRAIILLSDGDDNQSRHTREEAIEAALRAEVIIYVICTETTSANSKGEKVLMRYADATGGKVFFPERIEEASKSFAEIQDELRSQYVLAYEPADSTANGSYHAITVEVPKRPNVKIRARKGYYTPKKG